ncbi:methyltransferase domain-containing protein [Bacillus sp. FJAT-42376]|uniref:TRM11 family SAM-dependent methyltransferase n=1 Tax=Bacillus sp. FJAT-42376 TaxID=2014076 RepID=UPI000F5178E7|nr:methyltransferase domain-containing protein [Bacillus sp. FJAT-42376]AZB43111.1 methyltransferase domain-containing protein [Bacillus sp. FJAT-42376]
MRGMETTDSYLYTYTYSREEESLCKLELRSLFGGDVPEHLFKSDRQIPVGRSPFIRERIDILYEGESLAEISGALKEIQLGDQTFKIICVKQSQTEEGTIAYNERRMIERELGQSIDAEADVHHPDRLFGVAAAGGRWYFGTYERSEAVWLRHIQKPRQYSTALSTKVARALVNIAVPAPAGMSVIDPCCGIGNVLVEALSMGIPITGRDMNPLAVTGARENIAHFGFDAPVFIGPIEEATGRYDVAIIDLPYNLYTHITVKEQISIIEHAKRIADKCVFVTIDPIDEYVRNAGLEIIDRGEAIKGKFSREILVCK